MHNAALATHDAPQDQAFGRIVSVAGSKAIVMLDHSADWGNTGPRPEMGTLLAVETSRSVILATVCALSVPVPAQRQSDVEFWMAELSLVGELKADPAAGGGLIFARGTSSFPALGDGVRLATRHELQMAFSTRCSTSVRVGSLRQDDSIAVHLNVDELLGKHFAILGSTGTGKSCTAALILRSILERNRAAHIVLIDPHNEYATAFTGLAEVISPGNLQLPLWMLNFEETVEIFVPDQDRKAEIEILAELIPIAKARFAAGRAAESARLRRPNVEPGRCSVDAPLPYRVSDLLGLIDERMGRLENKRELHPYRQLRQRIEAISLDGRYSFLFGSFTVTDDMTQVLGRLFRVPLRDKPLTILELTGLPSEVVNVVVAVLCRLTFEFAMWSEGRVPVTLVCEEAHRYVPASSAMGFAPCKRAIAKIAKEGRKYGASLCVVTQRPAEIDATILSQCNTVFALRLSNDRDQEIVSSAITDTSVGLLEFLPALGKREALAFGDGVALPVRILFDELPADCLPRSTTARFTQRWQVNEVDENFLAQVVERWRAASTANQASAIDAVAESTTELLPQEAHTAADTSSASPTKRSEATASPHLVKSAHLSLRERLLRPQAEKPRSP